MRIVVSTSLGIGTVDLIADVRARTAAALRYARLMYRFSRGSTLSLSPTFTNSGTCTTAPVSRVAGFVTFETVSPLTPGSVSVTSSTTDPGNSSPDGEPPTNRIWTDD